jgi:hypothetical protein
MQPCPTRADADAVLRLPVLVVCAAFLLSGCSTAEGTRAQELLQQAELAQAKLQSATFEANIGVVMDGKEIKVALQGAASKQGAAFSMHMTGLPDAGSQDFQLVVRGNSAWMTDAGGNWTSMPVPKELNGQSSSMGADAFQELARYVKDVRVAEHQQIGGKTVATIAGEIDTAGMLQAFAKLGSLSGTGAENGGFSFDLDDLGVKVGDIKAVLSIDERTHLLDTALVTVAIDANGEKLELKVQYRLTSADEPVTLPSPAG